MKDAGKTATKLPNFATIGWYERRESQKGLGPAGLLRGGGRVTVRLYVCWGPMPSIDSISRNHRGTANESEGMRHQSSFQDKRILQSGESSCSRATSP
jgi:hypothetical protein